MCGIYGEITLSPTAELSVNSREGVEALNHRGPDAGGCWSGENVFLGMRRLSIIDLTGGMQPIWNSEHTICIVYNGELYNFLEIRTDLQARGHVFQTDSDTEVVLHAYEEWREHCLARFNGMFAFAIWDIRLQKLFLARDRIGEKPLYYYQDHNRLVFASEIKAILTNPYVPRVLNERGLINYLTFGYAIAPNTIYKSIYKLLPAHYMVVTDGHVSTACYWNLGDEAEKDDITLLTEEEIAERLFELLDDSVQRRMIADVPVGAFLSGGIDSSAVIALMKRHASDKVKAFSIGFDVPGMFNELPDAERVATYLNVEHYKYIAQADELLQALRLLVYHYDEPFADVAGFPLYVLSRFASQEVKVVLTGDGGDELFGGYGRYQKDAQVACYQRFPGILQKSLPAAVGLFPSLSNYQIPLENLAVSDPALRYLSWLSVFSPNMLTNLLTPDILVAAEGYDARSAIAHYFYEGEALGLDTINRYMYLDLKSRLPDAFMEKTDKATMACSLEARLPLLDPRIVEFAFQIPSRRKIRNKQSKYILKKAIARILPENVMAKQKQGFAVPISLWLRGPLREFAFDILFDARSCSRGIWQEKYVKELWQTHENGSSRTGKALWTLLIMELWHRIYMDNGSL